MVNDTRIATMISFSPYAHSKWWKIYESLRMKKLDRQMHILFKLGKYLLINSSSFNRLFIQRAVLLVQIVHIDFHLVEPSVGVRFVCQNIGRTERERGKIGWMTYIQYFSDHYDRPLIVFNRHSIQLSMVQKCCLRSWALCHSILSFSFSVWVSSFFTLRMFVSVVRLLYISVFAAAAKPSFKILIGPIKLIAHES